MKVKCSVCEIEDIGRYNKLVDRGWKIFFLRDRIKVVRCKKCKPNITDKIKKTFNKDYKSNMYYEIRDIMNKIKVLDGLKTEEELREERFKRFFKRSKHYHYQRNKKNEK